MVKILKKEGYDDGYYWDRRIVFEYEGQIYTLIDVGSCSGYIPCYLSITYGDISEETLCAEELTADDVDIPEVKLIEMVEKLKESGDSEWTFAEED